MNFYSHIPCGMWHHSFLILCCSFVISTHTSRVGCDTWNKSSQPQQHISTHTSRVGCDYMLLFVLLLVHLFLLTHPVWDVTQIFINISCINRKFLLTHPVWDVTSPALRFTLGSSISTHTSRVGCDFASPVVTSTSCRFLLTHPVWDVT